MKTWIVVAFAITAGIVGVAHADQDNMRRALDELRHARQQVANAGENKQGNRARALRHIDNAITQVQQGIQVAGEKK